MPDDFVLKMDLFEIFTWRPILRLQELLERSVEIGVANDQFRRVDELRLRVHFHQDRSVEVTGEERRLKVTGLADG